MAATGTVVEFATGRTASPPPGPRSVATIAEAMARNAGIGEAPLVEPPPLPVRLDALCGVDDVTIARLAHIASSGSLTAESAARLAIRHAEEIGRHDRRREWVSPIGPAARFEISVSGDLFDDYAMRVARASDGPRVCAAPASRVDRLLTAFPARGFDICLLVSETARLPVSVRILSQVGWRRNLGRRRDGPAWSAVRHLVVVGGLPSDPYDRAAIVVGIRDAIRRARRRRSGAASPGPLAPLTPPVRRILPLIELALPGLVSTR